MVKYMTEYIDKEKAIYLVEKAVSKADALTALRRMSAADVEQVVRCEKCKFSEPLTPRVVDYAICADVKDNTDFCSEGEKRDDND